MADTPEPGGDAAGSADPGSPVPAGSAVRRPRAVGIISTFVIAAVVLAGVALLFHAQAYKPPGGTLVATPAGSATVNGKTIQHVTLAFNTYPDSTGMVNGSPIHPGGNRGLAGLRAHQPVPGAGPRPGDRHRPPVRLGWRAQQPVLRHGAGHRGERGRHQREGGPLHRPQQRGPHLHRPRDAGDRPGILPERAASRRSRATARPTTASTSPSRSASCRAAKGTYAWNCEFPCGTSRSPASEGRCRLRVHVGIHPCRLRSQSMSRTPTSSRRLHRPELKPFFSGPAERSSSSGCDDHRRGADRHLRAASPPADHAVDHRGRRCGGPSCSSPSWPPRWQPSSTPWLSTASSGGRPVASGSRTSLPRTARRCVATAPMTAIWLGISAVLVIVLLVWGLGEFTAEETSHPNTLQVDVTGQQWLWTFTYPGAGNVETRSLVLPINRPVQFNVTSVDVTHGFWPAALGVQVDANPNVVTVIAGHAGQAGRLHRPMQPAVRPLPLVHVCVRVGRHTDRSSPPGSTARVSRPPRPRRWRKSGGPRDRRRASSARPEALAHLMRSGSERART